MEAKECHDKEKMPDFKQREYIYQNYWLVRWFVEDEKYQNRIRIRFEFFHINEFKWETAKIFAVWTIKGIIIIVMWLNCLLFPHSLSTLTHLMFTVVKIDVTTTKAFELSTIKVKWNTNTLTFNKSQNLCFKMKFEGST